MELRLDASALQGWLQNRQLTPEHIEAVRELLRNFALWMSQEFGKCGAADFSYLASGLANDWEGQMLLVTAGYPLQAMAFMRSGYEKLAFLKLFLTDPDEAAREHARLQQPDERPLHSQRLIIRAFGDQFYREVFKNLHQYMHADLVTLRYMQVNLLSDPPEASSPRFHVGPSYDWQFSYVLSLVLQSGSTLALNVLLLLDPPLERQSHLVTKVTELISSLRATGLAFSDETDRMLAVVQSRFLAADSGGQAV